MTIKPGAFRFNTDSMKLEIFRGSANYSGTASMAGIGTLAAGQWEEIQATSPEVQTGGTRGLIAGGYDGGSQRNEIDYINVDTTGNAIDFGDMTTAGQNIGGGSASRTRGIAGGMASPTVVNTIEFITIASTGDSVNFGDLTDNRTQLSNFSNSTRSIFAGGNDPSALNIIDYITIASTGDAKDFGDLFHGGGGQQASCASPTRG